MNHYSAKTKIIAVVLLAGVLPLLASVAAHLIIGDAKHVQEPLHEGFELAGTCIALSVAMLLLLRLGHENASSHLLWVVAALVAMGIVDGVHSFLPTGVAFSWTRHGATVVGGALFALVWLPLPAVVVRRKQHFIFLVAVLAIAGSLAILRWPERLPAPWVAGNYSRLVIAVNALGGLGFLTAALFFIRRYLREPQTEDLVFASQTLFFSTASLFFGLSHVWAADWWVWHGARLLAYVTVLVAAYETVVALYQHIARYAKELETANAALRVEITERKRAEEELKKTLADLERSNKELEQFAYVASHDLQEPLRMVASFTQLLGQRYGGKLDKDADDFIRYAVDGANRLQALINDLLSYSRVSTRGKALEPIACEDVLARVHANLLAMIEETGTILVHDPLPTVVADETQMVQLFQNLVQNAIKFRRDESPRIHVAAQREGDEWVFSVRDNGIGIDAQYFDRIFVIFQRLHGKEEYPGTGIGLAMCRRIVERHAGRIWVESEPGRGSTFYFALRGA